MVIVLDAGPLGLLSHPKPEAGARIGAWARRVLGRGDVIVIPEIADYEVRRELTRARRFDSVRRLDDLANNLRYQRLTTASMRLGAELWAEARHQGRPTAADPALDGDVLLAAQTRLLGADAVVATTNVDHLGRMVPARLWQDL